MLLSCAVWRLFNPAPLSSESPAGVDASAHLIPRLCSRWQTSEAKCGCLSLGARKRTSEGRLKEDQVANVPMRGPPFPSPLFPPRRPFLDSTSREGEAPSKPPLDTPRPHTARRPHPPGGGGADLRVRSAGPTSNKNQSHGPADRLDRKTPCRRAHKNRPRRSEVNPPSVRSIFNLSPQGPPGPPSPQSIDHRKNGKPRQRG